MSFSNNVSSGSSVIESFGSSVSTIVSDLNSSWSGTAYKFFESSMSKIQTEISNVQTHFQIYSAVAEIAAAVEILKERIAKLIAYRNTLEEPDPALDAEIERLEAEKKAKIASAVSMLSGISSSSGNGEISGEVLNSATAILSGDVVGSAKEFIKDTDYSYKLTPTCIEDIDLGEGKYMTDSDWEKSPYVSKEEFKCKCGKCDGYPSEISKTLIEDINKIRFYYNTPVTITSGLRCKSHNDSFDNSSPNSYHVKGQAVDMIVPGVSKSEVMKYIKSSFSDHLKYTYSDDTYMGNAVHFEIYNKDN